MHRACLEENYRSTKAILSVALSVVQQDAQRIDKGLYTSHPQGAPVTLRAFADVDAEADFAALEIERMVRCSGGLLTYADASILLRFNAQSRAFEAALQRLGVPYRVIGGPRFFDRAEVRDLLAYLLLVDNPAYTPGVVRVLNVPRRGLGAKSVQTLQAMAQAAGTPLLPYVEQLAAHGGAVRPAVLKGVQSFVAAVARVRAAADQVRDELTPGRIGGRHPARALKGARVRGAPEAGQ